MADGTSIEWTDMTWNPITGCSVVSPGCTNCYAMQLAGTRLKHTPSRAGLTAPSKAGPVWTGEVRFNAQWLDQPLQLRRPRMIFVCAHGDLFAERVPDEWIDRVFAVMALAPQHRFQVLTKRPERMRAYLRGVIDSGRWLLWQHPVYGHEIFDPIAAKWDVMLNNVWLGVSVEDQRRADERVPILLDTPAAVRWISAEPLLGPLDITEWTWPREDHGVDMTREVGSRVGACTSTRPALDWVVAGGESGPNARPMHPDWGRSLRDQCAADHVPFLFKQWGQWLPTDQDDGQISFANHKSRQFADDLHTYRVGKKAAGRDLDGMVHDGFPMGSD